MNIWGAEIFTQASKTRNFKRKYSNYVKIRALKNSHLPRHRRNEIPSSFFPRLRFVNLNESRIKLCTQYTAKGTAKTIQFPSHASWTDWSICAASASAAPSFTFYFRPSSKQNKLLQLVWARGTKNCCTERYLSLFSVKKHKKNH